MRTQNTPQPPTRPAVPSPEPYTFTSPSDTPQGASYFETPDGFRAVAQASSALMAAIFGGISAVVAYVLYAGLQGEDGAPLSFVVFLGGVLGLTTIVFLFFLVGREGIEVRKNRLLLRKTLFGIGFTKTMNLPKIERVQVKNRSGMRGMNIAIYGVVKDRILEVEDDQYIKTMGSNMDPKHLYYFRYLVIEAVKAARNPVK